MDHEIKANLYQKGADMVRFIDISELTSEQRLGFNKAIIIIMALSPDFILAIKNEKPVDGDDFLAKEEKVEALADWLMKDLTAKGYKAYALSEKNNLKHLPISTPFVSPATQDWSSVLPQKTVARLGGLGFIGKNNLLITSQYGCAISMCTVLTDAPIATENLPPLESKCGSCNICKQVCPGEAIHGNHWQLSGGREDLVDVFKCFCVLKCMVHCPWTLRYAEKNAHEYKTNIMQDNELILRPYSQDDHDALVEQANNFNVSRYLSSQFPYPYKSGDALAWLNKACNESPDINLAIQWQGQFIGGIGLDALSDFNAEIGYWLGEQYWGQGFGTRALKLFLTYCFHSFTFKRLQSSVFVDNKASKRVLEKNGFKKEGLLRAYIHRNGKLYDVYIFSLLRSEFEGWQQKKEDPQLT